MTQKLHIVFIFLFSIAFSSLQAQEHRGKDSHSTNTNSGFNNQNPPCEAHIPNAFTPNGDGINDEFFVRIPDNCDVLEYQLYIFDRYGRQVFSSNDYLRRWDGSYDGQPLSDGVYMLRIMVRLQNPDTGEIFPIERKASVLLIR